MDKRYTALRVIATIYKIIGVLVALLTVLAVVLMIVGVAGNSRSLAMYGLAGPEMIVIAVISTLLGGGLGALGIFAVGEALFLLINLEENTRYTAILLRDRQPQ
jgi:hypothetical protein